MRKKSISRRNRPKNQRQNDDRRGIHQDHGSDKNILKRLAEEQ